MKFRNESDEIIKKLDEIARGLSKIENAISDEIAAKDDLGFTIFRVSRSEKQH